jgi:hypothetical protein
MNMKLFAGLTFVTGAFVVACAPVNAHTTSSLDLQNTVTYQSNLSASSSSANGTNNTYAQIATNARIVDFSTDGAMFKVELKKCFRTTDPDGNVICDFVFTVNSSQDVKLTRNGYVDTFRFFRAFDSSGSEITIKLARKGNDGWRNAFRDQIFVAQFPTPVSIKFKMPEADTVVTFLDLTGDKVVRFAQIPIDMI